MTTKTILATGIDAGSNYTRVMIGLVEDEKLRFLGCGCSPAAGWSKSRIVDQQAVSKSILAAVEQAEAMAQVHVETAVAGVGGFSVRGARFSIRSSSTSFGTLPSSLICSLRYSFR